MSDELKLEPGVMIDPPAGWRYGFPLRYEPMDGESVNEFLIRKGYPPSMLHLAERATRFWKE